MPDSLLTILRLLLLSLIWLFFVRVLFLLAAKPRAATAVTAPAAAPSAAPPTRAPSSGKANLRVVSAGPFASKEFTVGNEATVGRGQGCQVQLNDPMVSQLHARLFRSDRGLSIEDLGSTNGTFLNGRKVGAAARLKKGDRIRVGPVELEVIG
jgi:pSer/pThr/pTyr-binding forkhead associated (FHA) protein